MQGRKNRAIMTGTSGNNNNNKKIFTEELSNHFNVQSRVNGGDLV